MCGVRLLKGWRAIDSIRARVEFVIQVHADTRCRAVGHYKDNGRKTLIEKHTED